MELLTHASAVLGLTLLCAGWVMVQLLARAVKTKNHLNYEKKGCGHCAQHRERQECQIACKEESSL
ncbi:MAG: hypothetical protein HQM14_07630 [SAR324 cluster bacterium]|nr:hypothetical protein [SAR324 cluster bacterium]